MRGKPVVQTMVVVVGHRGVVEVVDRLLVGEEGVDVVVTPVDIGVVELEVELVVEFDEIGAVVVGG
ncbi:MAG TPA: hypothetical protein VK425_10355 [Acidimicrobiales bacterium]|nr:hypothetical protein [Acidimicrobiales bacterium]